MKNLVARTIAVAALGLASLGANASLLGDTVNLDYVGVGSATTSAVVGAGEDGNFFGNQFFDFGDFDFSIRSTGSFCGIWACGGEPVSLILSDLDFGAALTGVDFQTTLQGVQVAFTENSVTFSWMEQALNPETYINAQFLTGPVGVAEPATLGLMGLGLVGLLRLRRRA